MKKLVILNVIRDEETFIHDVVYMMPTTYDAKFEDVDMESCIWVKAEFAHQAKEWLKKYGVRVVIE